MTTNPPLDARNARIYLATANVAVMDILSGRGHMLTAIYRDLAALPEEYQQALRDQGTLFADVLTAPFGRAGGEHRRLPAVTGHAISFWTWRSLCLDHGLTDTEAVDAMTGMVLAIIPVPQAEPAH
jgi:hypothetical protein